MKKFLLLPVLALLFASCSTDNDVEMYKENAVEVTTTDYSTHRSAMAAGYAECISSLVGNVSLNAANGWENLAVNFIADVPNAAATTGSISYYTKPYNVTLEIQLIGNCENLESGYGPVTRYTLNNVSLPSVSDPVITLTPAQLPDTCYRWRYVVEGTTVFGRTPSPCVTQSNWYEEPLL